MNLFIVELRRVFARRLTWVLAIIGLGGILIGGLTTFAQAGRMRDVASFTGNGVVHTLGKAGFELTDLREIWAGSTAGFAFFAVLLGASLIGADWRSGTVGLQLTWEPRRVRLALAKVGVAMTVAFGAYLIYAAILGLAMVPAAVVHGSTAGMDASWWLDALGVLLRGAMTSAVFIAIGFSIALVGRNAAAALGVLFVYSAIIENVLAGRYPWMSRWLLIRSVVRFVSAKEIDDVVHQSTAAAGMTLIAYGVIAVAISVEIFRSRDVT